MNIVTSVLSYKACSFYELEMLLIYCGVWKNSQEPILPGCFLHSKAIGVMPMIDQVFYILNSYMGKVVNMAYALPRTGQMSKLAD